MKLQCHRSRQHDVKQTQRLTSSPLRQLPVSARVGRMMEPLPVSPALDVPGSPQFFMFVVEPGQDTSVKQEVTMLLKMVTLLHRNS